MNITAKQILKTVKELAKENPDTVYVSPNDEGLCFYTKGACSNGTEGCIIGQALVKLGVPKETLAELDEKSQDITGLLRNLDMVDLATFDDNDYLDELTKIQNRQDSGCSWGEAVS